MVNTKATVMSPFKLTVLICLCFQPAIIWSHSTSDPLRRGNWSFCWGMYTGWLHASCLSSLEEKRGPLVYLAWLNIFLYLVDLKSQFSNEAWRRSWAEFINAFLCCEMIYFCLALITCPLEFMCVPKEEQWMDVSCSRCVHSFLQNLSVEVKQSC